MSRFIKAVLVLLFLVSCGEGEKKVIQSDDRYGGILHINVPDNIYTLIPSKITNESEWFIARQVYETIVNNDANQIVPNRGLLGAIRQVHPDTIQYQFRKDVLFSNGNQLDSVAIGEWVKHLKISGLDCDFQTSSNSLIVHMTSIEQANTVLSERNSYLYSIADGIPVGTGPFALRSINEDISIDLEKTLNYHDPSLPYLDGVEVRMIKTKDTEVEEFINGSLDLIKLTPLHRLQFQNILSLDNHPNYQLRATDEKAYCFALVSNMDSVEAYQLGKVLNGQPTVFDMSEKPRRLDFPNLSQAKITQDLGVDSDKSIFSQLTIESLIEKGVSLNAIDQNLGDQKSIFLTTGVLGVDGIPRLEAPAETLNVTDYLIILNSWSGLAVYQYYLKTEDQTDRGMIDLKSFYFKRPIKLE
ncbi:MAG: ABC transporter substrate-binding protein [Cyclobacteriaceae bacterium]